MLNKSTFIIFLTILFLLFIVIIRRSDALTNPQFHAEDGIYWFKQAYDVGSLQAAFIPIDGYYQTLSRIGGALAQFVPLQYAPLVFNLIAIAAQLLPVIIMLLPGFGKIFPHRYIRMFLLVSYLTLPNIAEVYINLTNAQWFLAFSALLALLFLPKGQYFWLKVILFALTGLSGPFAILLLPLALVYYKDRLFKKDRQVLVHLGILSFTGLIQLITILTSGERSAMIPSDFSLPILYGIFYKQIVIGVLLGPNGYEWIANKVFHAEYIFNIIGILGISIVIYCLWKAALEIKLTIAFAFFIFFTSILSPALGPTVKSPLLFLFTEWNSRYWMIPMMVFLFAVAWVLGSKTSHIVIKVVALVLVTSMILFQIKNYRHYHNFAYPSYINLDFQKYVRDFEELPSGKGITIPINPPEDRWRLHLIKD